MLSAADKVKKEGADYMPNIVLIPRACLIYQTTAGHVNPTAVLLSRFSLE